MNRFNRRQLAFRTFFLCNAHFSSDLIRQVIFSTPLRKWEKINPHEPHSSWLIDDGWQRWIEVMAVVTPANRLFMSDWTFSVLQHMVDIDKSVKLEFCSLAESRSNPSGLAGSVGSMTGPNSQQAGLEPDAANWSWEPEQMGSLTPLLFFSL